MKNTKSNKTKLKTHRDENNQCRSTPPADPNPSMDLPSKKIQNKQKKMAKHGLVMTWSSDVRNRVVVVDLTIVSQLLFNQMNMACNVWCNE